MGKKEGERIYLDNFLKSVGWPSTPADVDEGEEPDFIVSLGTRRVGVEVTQVFADQAIRNSKLREDESRRLSWLREFARDYYEAGGVPVRVLLQFEPSYFVRSAGDVPIDVRERLLARLRARARSLEVEGSMTSRLRGKHRRPLATMTITALPDSFGRYSRWRLLNDAMAWVPLLTTEHVEHIVARKAKRLAAYRRKVAKVALVIVADGFLASGLVRYEGGQVAAHGFEAVYFLNYPAGKVQQVAGTAV